MPSVVNGVISKDSDAINRQDQIAQEAWRNSQADTRVATVDTSYQGALPVASPVAPNHTAPPPAQGRPVTAAQPATSNYVSGGGRVLGTGASVPAEPAESGGWNVFGSSAPGAASSAPAGNANNQGNRGNQGGNRQPAMGYPVTNGHMGNRNPPYGNQQMDEDEMQHKCMMMCCGSCCPCCVGDPFTESWRNTCFNTWFKTFVGVTGLLIFVIFIVETCLSPHDKNIGGYMSLDPDVLSKMGAKTTVDIVVNFEVWRLVTCVLLHAGWMHMLMNLFVQMTLGWMMETGKQPANPPPDNPENPDSPYTIQIQAPWGAYKMALIYWWAGITGGLLGCACDPSTMCVGASGAIMGIIGAKLAHLYFNWNSDGAEYQPLNENNNPQQRNLDKKMQVCMSVFWVILIFSLGLGNPLVDNWAHLGGLIGGMLTGGFLFSDLRPGVDDDGMDNAKWVGRGCGFVHACFDLFLVGYLFTVVRADLMPATGR